MGRIQSFLIVLVVLGLASCSSRDYQAPLFERTKPTQRGASPASQGQIKSSQLPATYRVKRGDTLYSIAWRFHLNYKTLARWNAVAVPYTIYVGQRLLFQTPKPALTVASASPAKVISKPISRPVKSTVPKAPKMVVSKPPAAPKQVPVASRLVAKQDNKNVRWAWPLEGKLISGFSKRKGRPGIRLQGKPGQVVRASADGKVVFSSSGLVGYPNLIIVEHNDDFLSAYAYSAKRLVEEGERVKQGQKIALLSVNRLQKPKLHFEIRFKGDAVNPVNYLAKK